MADLSVNLCGVSLPNPLVLASGPLTWNAEAIQAAFSAGVAAVVTKTIRPQATVNPVPHIADVGRGSLLNTEGWSDLAAEDWLQDEFPALRERRGVVRMAGLVGQSEIDQFLVSEGLFDAGPDDHDPIGTHGELHGVRPVILLVPQQPAHLPLRCADDFGASLKGHDDTHLPRAPKFG